MSEKKDKGPLRNFNLLKEADENLNARKTDTGRPYVTIVEDLLLGRRMFSEKIERWITEECERTGLGRWDVIGGAIEFTVQQQSGPRPTAARRVVNSDYPNNAQDSRRILAETKADATTDKALSVMRRDRRPSSRQSRVSKPGPK